MNDLDFFPFGLPGLVSLSRIGYGEASLLALLSLSLSVRARIEGREPVKSGQKVI